MAGQGDLSTRGQRLSSGVRRLARWIAGRRALYTYVSYFGLRPAAL